MSTQYINEPTTSGKVILQTSAGDIEVELWSKECPLACRNFVQLCMEGYYNGTIFHRFVRDFILQGGDPTGTGTGGESIYDHPFKDEFHQRLRFTRRGLLGMANAGPNDNGSQFFFTVGNDGLKALDKKHTLFGKITGPTVFNMLKMVECDVDENERPKTIYKIVSTKIVSNPFDDIKPREKVKKSKDKKKEKKVVATKKLNLLSFGDEAEEDEMELDQVNQALCSKGKSAHDVLEDEKLSTQVAVTKDEMEDYDPEEDEDREKDTTSTLAGIRAKFAKKRKVADDGGEEDKDEDFEQMIDTERKKQRQQELDAVKEEVLALQKQYKKDMRKPKEKKEEEEEEQTEAMQMYHALKLKFKSKSANVVKQRDPERENQTMSMLEKFQKKLESSNQQAILFDKKVVVKEDVPKQNEEKKFGIDLDAEDDVGADWMAHKFVAEDDDSAVSKAKDANMRETSEDWYALNDPRNKMNKRRRGEE